MSCGFQVSQRNLKSPCPPGMVSLASLNISTYDPTRSVPPAPPLATCPINQPTKTKINKWIRTLARERERLRRLEEEEELVRLAALETEPETTLVEGPMAVVDAEESTELRQSELADAVPSS